MAVFEGGTNPERESAILSGARGIVEYENVLHRSDQEGRTLGTISTNVENATVDLSNERDHTWELSMPLREVEGLDLFGDYVLLETRIRDRDDWFSYPMGHYRFGFPKGSDLPYLRKYGASGKSAESVLAGYGAHEFGYSVAAGSWVLAAVRQILVTEGIPGYRINFPQDSNAETDVQVPYTQYFDPLQNAQACYWLAICNHLLAIGGFYSLWCDAVGRFTTQKIEETRQGIPASARYGTTDDTDRMITGPIDFEFSEEDVANRVLVYGGDPNQRPPIVGIAENRDPESRLSKQRYGTWIQPEPIIMEQIGTQYEADLLAKAFLRSMSAVDLRLQINSKPDPRRGPREPYYLDIRRDDRSILWQGIWRCETWQMNMDYTSMQHRLNREVYV